MSIAQILWDKFHSTSSILIIIVPLLIAKQSTACPVSEFALHRFMKVDSISAVIFHLFILKGGYKEIPTAPSHIITTLWK